MSARRSASSVSRMFRPDHAAPLLIVARLWHNALRTLRTHCQPVVTPVVGPAQSRTPVGLEDGGDEGDESCWTLCWLTATSRIEPLVVLTPRLHPRVLEG
jgi:hypothetical protein